MRCPKAASVEKWVWAEMWMMRDKEDPRQKEQHVSGFWCKKQLSLDEVGSKWLNAFCSFQGVQELLVIYTPVNKISLFFAPHVRLGGRRVLGESGQSTGIINNFIMWNVRPSLIWKVFVWRLGMWGCESYKLKCCSQGRSHSTGDIQAKYWRSWGSQPHDCPGTWSCQAQVRASAEEIGSRH